jgi:hypothetical protein
MSRPHRLPIYHRLNEMPWSLASTRVDSTRKLGLGMDRSAASRYPALRLQTSPEMEC